ncbi:hypothetical protein [Azospirillum picis]|uniref:DUF222 domain-containing protein n=1 Tax=Azospirillum picis TaxID=488438 RepID=A0ABU0MPB0_9PROT|nr:hypothetical protein [Azospirillum picis]MBP2301473.1 hypothetical protein [Azospirillum picis]MDQ0535305.1 hypothetical protein [Azospirillum picis]
MTDNRDILDLANRFEAIAADGFEGRPYRPALADLARRTRSRPEVARQVAHALGIMIGLIGDSDPAGRFAVKTAILREAVEMLAGE